MPNNIGGGREHVVRRPDSRAFDAMVDAQQPMARGNAAPVRLFEEGGNRVRTSRRS